MATLKAKMVTKTKKYECGSLWWQQLKTNKGIITRGNKISALCTWVNKTYVKSFCKKYPLMEQWWFLKTNKFVWIVNGFSPVCYVGVVVICSFLCNFKIGVLVFECRVSLFCFHINFDFFVCFNVIVYILMHVKYQYKNEKDIFVLIYISKNRIFTKINTGIFITISRILIWILRFCRPKPFTVILHISTEMSPGDTSLSLISLLIFLHFTSNLNF